jgi:hypothetical protein
MSKNVKQRPWVFDAAGQMEGFDRPQTLRTYGTFTSATSDVTTMAEHGLTTGFGPVQVSTSGTLPTGLTASTDYWLSVEDRDTFKFCTSLKNAMDGTVVDITGTGSGTHTMSAYNIFNAKIYIDQIKVDTGDGGDFLLTWDADAQGRLLKLDNTPANDTLWVPIRKRVQAVYVQTLPTNGSVEVYTGYPED